MTSLLKGAMMAAVLLISFFVLLVKVVKVGRRPSGLPPGPPTIPILGNLHLMPTDKPHLQFQKWAQEYGPVYSLILGTQVMIVLSSDTAVKDLLDRKSGNYSDRPDMYIGQDVASGGLRLVVMESPEINLCRDHGDNLMRRQNPSIILTCGSNRDYSQPTQKYGSTWRMIHKMIHNILNIKAAITYVPYQDLENKLLLVGLLDSPVDFLDHLRRYTFSLSTQMIFGFRCPDFRDRDLQQLFWSFGKWGELAGSASAQIMDLFPILQRLPKSLGPNVRYAERLFEKEKDLYVRLWMRTKRGLENGTGKPCFCNDLLRAQKTEKFSDDLAGYTSGSLLEAGSDTTASILYGFIQAMLVWPEVQKKVQDEIDRVVGVERLPNIDDYASLPYVRSCIKESLRWMPTVILGVPHAALKEDTYMGYTIPEGATIINNVWGIHMDPQRSPDPRRFNPDRFMKDTRSLYESATGEAQKRDNYVFGAGRRMCQGIHIAERSLFLGISRMAWGFKFSPTLDSNNRPVEYDINDLVGGITVEPRHYTCIIEPRSQEKVDIIRSAAKECEASLDPHTGQWNKTPDGMAFSTWSPEKIDI